MVNESPNVSVVGSVFVTDNCAVACSTVTYTQSEVDEVWNGDDNYTDAKTSAEYTLTVTNKYAGTPGQRSCVGDTIAALVKKHGSLKAAANALGFASQNALRKDVQAYCHS